MRSRSILVTSLALAIAALVQFPAKADEHEERGRGEARHEGRAEGPAYRGEIHRFHEHDWEVWHGGHWERREHDGRLGWWWIAGGLWYFYPAPVYPYPDPYVPPPVARIAPAPEAPPPPPTPTVWYYCESAHAYYPYINSCPEGWHSVPAKPAR